MPPKRKAMAIASSDSLNSRSNKSAKHDKAQSTTPASSKSTKPSERHKPSGATRPNYHDMKLPELKEELKKRRLKISGRAGELVERLNQSDHDRSLPVKQAIEAAARKRREENPPPQEDDWHPQFDRSQIRQKEVRKNGPEGKPVFDDWGYELSFEKVSAPSTTNKTVIMNRQEAYFERKEAEDEQKTRIMFGVSQSKEILDSSAMDWQVSNDLAIPWHKVEIYDYEVWHEMGFQAERKDFVQGRVDPAVDKKIGAQRSGAAFRK